MSEKLALYIPDCKDLWYRSQLMSDAETMAYNKGYDLGFDEYHNDTGCIDFPEDQWSDFYEYFVGNKTERFYAYLVREKDNQYVGEVNLHRNPGEDWYEMGIVIEAKYRGLGYGVLGLEKLVEYAFEELNATEIHNSFEEERVAALQTHLRVGFTIASRHDGLVEVAISRQVKRGNL